MEISTTIPLSALQPQLSEKQNTPHASTEEIIHLKGSYRSDGHPALELAGGLLIAPLNLDARPALCGDLADVLASLADDGAHHRVVHEHQHAAGLLGGTGEARRTQLADGGELSERARTGQQQSRRGS